MLESGMDFELTDEQTLLKKTAREFVENVCPPERAKAWDEAENVPAELFDGLADLGWFSLPFAETDGGGRAHRTAVAEAKGAELAPCRQHLTRTGAAPHADAGAPHPRHQRGLPPRRPRAEVAAGRAARRRVAGPAVEPGAREDPALG